MKKIKNKAINFKTRKNKTRKLFRGGVALLSTKRKVPPFRENIYGKRTPSEENIRGPSKLMVVSRDDPTFPEKRKKWIPPMAVYDTLEKLYNKVGEVHQNFIDYYAEFNFLQKIDKFFESAFIYNYLDNLMVDIEIFKGILELKFIHLKNIDKPDIHTFHEDYRECLGRIHESYIVCEELMNKKNQLDKLRDSRDLNVLLNTTKKVYSINYLQKYCSAHVMEQQLEFREVLLALDFLLQNRSMEEVVLPKNYNELKIAIESLWLVEDFKTNDSQTTLFDKLHFPQKDTVGVTSLSASLSASLQVFKLNPEEFKPVIETGTELEKFFLNRTTHLIQHFNTKIENLAQEQDGTSLKLISDFIKSLNWEHVVTILTNIIDERLHGRW